MMQNLDLDLNLTPTVKEKAVEWCDKRVKEVIKKEEWVQLQQLSKDLNCLEEEIGKIRPFSRDLPLVVDILEYVRLKLKDHLQLQEHEIENDNSDSGELVHDEETQEEVLIQKSDCGRDYYVMKSGFEDDPIGGKKKNFMATGHVDVQREQQQQTQQQRKIRRNWSRELHRRFVHVLEQLGGPHAVATPKHIIKLMNVNGLTKDEVKSHLQKYRLQCKKNSSVLPSTEYPTESTPLSAHRLMNGYGGQCEEQQVKKCSRTWRGGPNQRIGNQLFI